MQDQPWTRTEDDRVGKETYVEFCTPQDRVSVSQLDFILFYSLDDFHVLCIGNIQPFFGRR